MACPLDQHALNHLHDLASASVHGELDESDSYGVLTEMLIEHRVILGRRFIIFPQLRLYWNPQGHGDRRSNIPDIGLGRLMPDGARHLQGGAEQKVATESMRNFPNPADIIDDPILRGAMHEATLQASDQVKAAIKNGALPHDIPIKWIVAVGPYFIIRQFGPFNEADLITRGHRPNDSGDAELAQFLQALKATSRSRPITMPLYRIGTRDAAQALHGYLWSPEVSQLYSSTNRFQR